MFRGVFLSSAQWYRSPFGLASTFVGVLWGILCVGVFFLALP